MQRRAVSIKLITLMLLLMLTGAACTRSAVEGNANDGSMNANRGTAEEATSSTPPFPTKEPERYQATMVTSGSPGGQAGDIPGLSALTNREMFIARDGDKRRVETDLLPGVKVAYLQLPDGVRYMLYPAKKLYAEVKLDGSSSSNYSGLGVPSDFSADKLVNTAPTGAKYEKLGTEQVNGRTTTKYRVTTARAAGQDTAPSETIIWVDESLGMPIKSESTSQDSSKYSMELRDIKQEVDASQFELPKDYQKVTYDE
ncbi:MAG: hypothetical protein JOZ52_00560, partial [Acidobacteria bacterium]|nr:hypothetical protein [Acidobacteriota bacterium]